ncbi:MAG: pitrilysin family protein [Peptococcaceae bacterium]|nr:pitrilysin family protein [Peptococcaceae bacterium]
MYNGTEVKIHELSNGVRIITEKVPGLRSVSVGYWVGTGSRMEKPGEEGITHFIEHLMFKGTEKRTARDVAEALDSVGGQLNAFTAKEMTCYYARVMDEHLPLAIEVLSDMLFHSKFDSAAMDKERGVIKEEISMYEDTPDELIHDLFLATAWPENPLGKPILGTAKSLDQIDRDMVVNYIRRQYVPDRIVIAAAGNLEHDEVVNMVAPYFEGMKVQKQPPMAPAPEGISGSTKHLKKETGQIQVCLGTRGVALEDERNYPLQLLNNVLGGGLSSRLVQSIREERGLAYTTYSFNSAFNGTGIFAFYAGTSPRACDTVIQLFHQEMEKLQKEGITEKEFNRAKEQVRGGLYMGLENVNNRMNRLGRNLLLLDRVIMPEETMTKVNAVKIQDIPELAAWLFDGPQVLTTIGMKEE